MILGSATTRAMAARFLVGVWVVLSVVFVGTPVRAEIRPVGAARLAFNRPIPRPGSPPGATEPPGARQSDRAPAPAPPTSRVAPSGVPFVVVPADPFVFAPASPSAVATPSGPVVVPADPSPVVPASPSAVATPSGPVVVPADPSPVVPADPSVVVSAGTSDQVPLDLVSEIPTPGPAPRRPRFDVAVGMGGSFDGSGLVKGRTVLAPAFLLQVGVGDGPLGFEARLLSTQASGRFHQMCNGVTDMPVDRLAIDLLFALRPFASRYREDPRWFARFARSAAFNLGASGENGNVGAQSAFRLGVVAGAHIDLPVTPGTEGTELRVRLGVRRMVGGQAVAGAVTVSDTIVDIFGGLAVVF